MLVQFSLVAIAVCFASPPIPPQSATETSPDQAGRSQIMLSVTIAEMPRRRDRGAEARVRVLEPKAEEKLVHRIQKLRDQGKARLVAEPRMVTLDGQQASFLIGTQRAVEKPNGSARAGVTFEEAGIRIVLTPKVLKNGKIRVGVEPEVSRLEPLGPEEVPSRATQRIHTAANVKNGQTILIGGLQTSEADENAAKRETIILVTARIVEQTGKTKEPMPKAK